MKSDQLDFGVRFKDALEANEAPITQEGAAEWLRKRGKKLGVAISISGTMVFKYLNNQAVPRVDQGRRYALALGVCLEWLYTGLGPRQPLDDVEVQLVDAFREIAEPNERSRALGIIQGFSKSAVGQHSTRPTGAARQSAAR